LLPLTQKSLIHFKNTHYSVPAIPDMLEKGSTYHLFMRYLLVLQMVSEPFVIQIDNTLLIVGLL